MAIRTITFDSGTDGANYTWTTDFDTGTGTPLYEADAAAHGPMGIRIPAGSTSNFGFFNHYTATKIDIEAYFVFGQVIAGSSNEIHLESFRFDATSAEAARVYISTSGYLKLRTKGAVERWTSPTTLTVGTRYRVCLHLDAGTSATTGIARLAYYEGDSTTPVQDSGNITGIDVAGTAGVIYGSRIGKYNAVALTGAIDMDSVTLRTDSDATSAFPPFLLPTPVVTLVSASGNTATVSWPAVSGAASYTSHKAEGTAPAQGDFTLVATGVTSPYTFTGLSGGNWALGIRAEP